MSRLRFTLAQLMAVVLYIGFGIVALRNASACWASATFNLAIISVSVAAAAAYTRSEKGPMFWAGFATAGGARLVIWLLSSQTVGSLNGPPRPLIYKCKSYTNPLVSGREPYIAFTQTLRYLYIIFLGLFAAAIRHFVAVKDGQPNP
jgi:hypothetical protein